MNYEIPSVFNNQKIPSTLCSIKQEKPLVWWMKKIPHFKKEIFHMFDVTNKEKPDFSSIKKSIEKYLMFYKWKIPHVWSIKKNMF